MGQLGVAGGGMRGEEGADNVVEGPGRPETPTDLTGTDVATLVLLVGGLPGAGKSRLCKELVESWRLHRYGESMSEGQYEEYISRWIEYDSLEDTQRQKLQMQNETQVQRRKNETDDVCEDMGGSRIEKTLKGGPDTDEASEENWLGLQAWRDARQVAMHVLSTALKEECSAKCSRGRRSRSLLVLDDNFHLRSMRKQIYQLCQQHVAEHDEGSSTEHCRLYFAVIWVESPVEVCHQRNEQRPPERRVPRHVLEKLARVAEVPVAVDTSQSVDGPLYPWEQALRVIDGENSTISSTMDSLSMSEWILQLRTAIQRPDIAASSGLHLVPPAVDYEALEKAEQERLAKERKATLESQKHQLDQTLRKCVRAVAQIVVESQDSEMQKDSEDDKRKSTKQTKGKKGASTAIGTANQVRQYLLKQPSYLLLQDEASVDKSFCSELLERLQAERRTTTTNTDDVSALVQRLQEGKGVINRE